MKGLDRERLMKWRAALSHYRYMLLVLGIGVLLLVLPTGPEPEEKPVSAAHGEAFVLSSFEERLEDALSRVDGAGKVRVVLSLDGGSRQILAQDRERDGDGGGSAQTVTLGRGSGSQEVVPLQTMAPSFRGALVVCPGGGDPRVRLELAQAVSVLTGLGADCISICQGNT